ncbi:MAG: methionine--tRNA ligase [Myxococcales bacterium]|nr:methionine--tRNA ligase [Myxococcales bacterium]
MSSDTKSRRILVTSALPYANGHIHLGHMVEYIQTDIWVRFMRMRGHQVRYFCADDTHGTSIMIRAEQEGRSPEALIADMNQAHQRDFQDFQIRHDYYGSTNSDTNRRRCADIWSGLRQAQLVSEKDVTQLFDPEKQMFLADRFVKGKCPNCKSPDQYGDSCEKCGATYSAAELIDPFSTLSGATPEMRTAKHLFIQIESLHGFLEEWTQTDDHLQPSVATYLKGQFLSKPLRDWDVSRPAPYFGFEIPDSPGNYWYVWFDAPIGYMAATEEWCQREGEDFDAWWKSADTDIYHFIGKDITYFHALFWPGMLKASGYSLPRRVQVHGFLQVNGEKMSKARGTFIQARTYLDHLDPAYLRYFYATRLSDKVDDLDLDLAEFVTKVNSDLVNKVVNLAARSAGFVKDGLSAAYPDDQGMFQAGVGLGRQIAEAYERCDYASATRLIMSHADRANAYFDEQAPWNLKKAGKLSEAQAVGTVGLNIYKQLVTFLAPILPKLASDSAAYFGESVALWKDAEVQVLGKQLPKFAHLMQRVDPDAVKRVLEATSSAAEEAQASRAASDEAASAAAEDDAQPLLDEPLAAECTIDDFMKVDLRVARVVSAEQVKEAKKLLKLTLSLGGEERRTVFAGIKEAYEPESLVGRLVVMVANLKPRQMKFGLSEGMVAAAGPGKTEVFLLAPDSGAKPGQRIH